MSVVLNTKKYSGKITQYPGFYEYKELKIQNPNQPKSMATDLIPFVLEVNIFESINSSTMSGSITIMDTVNMIKNVPIIGEETIYITVSDENETVDFEFYVYKISDRKQYNYSSMAYTLHFCSKELYLNSFKKVSKAYDRKLYEEAIIDIVQNYLDSKKFVIHASTKIPQCFIIPNWNPLSACKWMASKAQDSDYVGGNFVFYEDKDQFNFVALENLLDETKNQVFSEVSFDPFRKTVLGQPSYDPRQAEAVMRFEDWNIKKSLDTLENATFGMYKNKVKFVDIIQRGTEDVDYDYMTEFDKSTHLTGLWGNSHPLSSSMNLATMDENTPEMDTRLFLKHKGLFTNEVDGGDQANEWYSPRLSQILQINNFAIEGILPGQLELKAGMLLKFKMPSPEMMDVPNGSDKIDFAYSGNYLVTSVRRMFQREKFFLIIEMVKDSMSLDRDAITT